MKTQNREQEQEREALIAAIVALLRRMTMNWLLATYITCQMRADRPDFPERREEEEV